MKFKFHLYYLSIVVVFEYYNRFCYLYKTKPMGVYVKVLTPTLHCYLIQWTWTNLNTDWESNYIYIVNDCFKSYCRNINFQNTIQQYHQFNATTNEKKKKRNKFTLFTLINFFYYFTHLFHFNLYISMYVV